MAVARFEKNIIASSNLKDIKKYYKMISIVTSVKFRNGISGQQAN